MFDFIISSIIILSIIFLPLMGFLFGRINEKKHYRSIVEREEKYKHILLLNERHPPAHIVGQSFYLVNGSVVMSGDRFKQIIAGIKTIFGGRLTSYESMLDRGRREAILRMKEKASAKGATMIFNVHLSTATLNDTVSSKKSQLACAEILAYGTAWTTSRV